MIQCPECKRKNKTHLTKGKIKCRKCLQYIIIENGKGIACVPKNIFE